MFLVCQTAFRLYFLFFFFTPTPTTDIYTLSLHDALPIFEPVSVDEAFVDLTGTEGLFGSALDAVRAIKRRIREETCLTASAGLASNKFVAKVASELEKPDGLVAVAAGGEARFLAPLPVELIWGVGRVTAKALRELGLTTIGRLQR